MSEADTERLRAVRFVGPATAEVLAAAGIGPAAIRQRRISYRRLTELGVNPGVAARLRREHSLPWSESADGRDLARRSDQVRGLGEAERDWVAASSGEWDRAETPAAEGSEGSAGATGDWTPGGWPAVPDEDAPTNGDGDATADEDAPTNGDGDATADGSGDPVAAESAWRERSAPDPVTDLDGVEDDDADRLAEAGITSVRSLATADPQRVATALELPADRVRDWHDTARERLE